jgi:hypothetical protein
MLNSEKKMIIFVHIRDRVAGVSVEITDLGPRVTEALDAEFTVDRVESTLSSLPSQLANPTSTN